MDRASLKAAQTVSRPDGRIRHETSPRTGCHRHGSARGSQGGLGRPGKDSQPWSRPGPAVGRIGRLLPQRVGASVASSRPPKRGPVFDLLGCAAVVPAAHTRSALHELALQPHRRRGLRHPLPPPKPPPRGTGLQIARRLMAAVARGWQRPDVAFGRVDRTAQREVPQRCLAGCR